MMEYLGWAMPLVVGVVLVLLGRWQGRKSERERCAAIARMYYEERGLFIADAIESELLL